MCADNVSLELSMKVDADLSGLLVVVGEDSLVDGPRWMSGS